MDLVFKNNLEKLALKSKFSLTKFSESTGVSISTLSRILSGKIKKPNSYTVDLIADYFKIPSHLLLNQDIDTIDSFTEEYKHTSIRERILYLMKKHGISNVDDLSIMSDVPITTIKSIISGDSENPQLETCRKLADLFNISIQQLKCLQDLNKESNTYVQVPIILLSQFEKWKFNNSNDKYVKCYQKYIPDDKYSYFMIEVDNEFQLNNFDIGDILVFIDRQVIRSSGRYLCNINDKLSLYKIFCEENAYYYINKTENQKIKIQNPITYGELVEIKINCNKE